MPGEVRGDAGGEGISGRWDDDDRRRFVDRMEQRIERHAPGFTDRIVARHVMAPPDLEAANANLVGGDISGGTTQLHQQLVFRPVPGLGRAETPIRRLYLASASAHPGGAVHGACGANAARAPPSPTIDCVALTVPAARRRAAKPGADRPPSLGCVRRLQPAGRRQVLVRMCVCSVGDRA